MNQLSFNIACRGLPWRTLPFIVPYKSLSIAALASADPYQRAREDLKPPTSACGSLDNALQVNSSQYMWVAHMAAPIKNNIGFVGKYES